MTDPARYRSTCLADGCGGRLVVADDGAWHHVGPHGAGLHPPAPADPTPAEEASYQQGLLVRFRASLDAVTADPDHAERVLLRAARGHGVELTAGADPEPDPEPDAGPSSAAADRMSWAAAAGLIITPPGGGPIVTATAPPEEPAEEPLHEQMCQLAHEIEDDGVAERLIHLAAQVRRLERSGPGGGQ